MKTVSLNIHEPIYEQYQARAQLQNIPTSALIREAMSFYLEEKVRKSDSLCKWRPLSLGKIKCDYADGGFREEMFDDRY